MEHCNRIGRSGWAVLPLVIFALTAVPIASHAAETTGPNPGAPAGPGFLFLIKDGRARLDARNEKLSAVLEAIASRTGLIVVLDREADRDVSLDVRNATLSATLKHLLKDLNVAEVWEPAPTGTLEGQTVLARLYIYPKGKSAPDDPLIIGGTPAPANPVYIVQDTETGRPPSAEPAPGEGYYASVAAVKAYQEKKKLKFAPAVGRGAPTDSGASPYSPGVTAESMKAYLAKKALMGNKFKNGF